MKSKSSPPAVLLRFFRWFCNPKLKDSIEGDLIELYNERIAIKSKAKANYQLIIDILLLLRPGIIRSLKLNRKTQNYSYAMFRNYFKSAWRNLLNNKTFSMINIMGLALGLTCSMLIMLWVNDEYRVDSFHKNKKQLYVIFERQYYDGKINATYSTPGLMAAELKRVFPEVQYASSFGRTNMNTFQSGSKIIKEPGNYGGADFFKMFSYTLLEGNPETALSTVSSIAISRKMAEDFFGSVSAAMGKTVRFQNERDFQVTAVFENLPVTASDKFEYLLNWEAFLEKYNWAKDWGNNSPNTFIMLHNAADGSKVTARLTHFLDNYNKDQDAGFRIECSMQRYDEMYLHSSFKDGSPGGGRIEYVRLFSIVAVFVLLIAAINFMNLTTARSTARSKEIGIRKVIGALRGSIMTQFFGEAILTAIVAAILAMLLVALALPSFNFFTGKQIHLLTGNTGFWVNMLAVVVLTGVISGSYPALLLSSFRPVQGLKGKLSFSTGSALFRKVLVVFQFTLSAILITATIIITRQMNFIQTKNLGYNRENLLYISLEGELTEKYTLFKNEAVRLPGVQSVARISDAPTNINSSTGGVQWPGKNPQTNIQFTVVSTGYDFTGTMDLKMLQGRDFSEMFPSDSTGYILNEEAVSKIGYKDPLGKPLTLWGNKGTIIGVMQNFHFNSLHVPVKPMILHFDPGDNGGVVLVRLEAMKTKQALSGLETLCRTINPKFPFSYRFSDEEYSRLYRSEQVVGNLSVLFAALAIFISCLGLLGLSVFTAERRRKEISIRKILGAGPASLLILQSREFLKLVIMACVLALPLSAWLMYKWLQDYEYRVHLTWWMFVLPGLCAILISLLTISYHSIKSAIANPVKDLRTD